MYKCDSALRSECAFYITATWCVSRTLSRGERENRGIAQNSGKPGASVLQSGKETDSEGSGSHAHRSSARPGTRCLPSSKAQLFSGSWQCRCCLFLLKSPWLPPAAASALLPCRGRGSRWTPAAIQKKAAFLKPGRFGAVGDRNVTLQRGATCCATPRTGYFCSWAIMELGWRSPNDPCRRELISSLLQEKGKLLHLWALLGFEWKFH